MDRRIRALVLTAGRGQRLLPLTLFMPKPLLPIGDEPVVGHTLRCLGRAGCEAVALNLHHLPEAIPNYLGSSYYGSPLIYSFEENIQGTMGAIRANEYFLKKAEFIVIVNGDTMCPWPIRGMIKNHVKLGSEITILIHHMSPDPRLGGGVGIDNEGRVVELREFKSSEVKSRHVFAGVHILSRHVLDRIPYGPGDIVRDFYIPILKEGFVIHTVKTSSRWHDLGTPDRYLSASLYYSRIRWPKLHRPKFLSPLAEINEGANIKCSFIDRYVYINKDVQVEDSIVLSGAEISSGSRIEKSILGPGVRLSNASRIERLMVNRALPGYQVDNQESVMGDLIYTPIKY